MYTNLSPAGKLSVGQAGGESRGLHSAGVFAAGGTLDVAGMKYATDEGAPRFPLKVFYLSCCASFCVNEYRWGLKWCMFIMVLGLLLSPGAY